MGRKKLPVYHHIEIQDIAAEGKSLVKVNDIVVFVKDAIPGDIVDLQVTRKRKSYQEARVIKYIEYSSNRVDPFCSHFGVCGGCKWQHLPYDEQLRYKAKQVTDSIERIGRLTIQETDPIIGCDDTTFYRNKLEYTFSNHRWLTENETKTDVEISDRNGLGFHVPGRYDRVVDIEKCYLQEDPSNLIRNTLGNLAKERNLSFYDHNTNEGLLRNIIIRITSTKEIMVILSVQFDEPVIYELLEELYKTVPEITSLLYVINPKKNETLFDQDIRLFKGRDHIIEQLDEFKFKIGPKSFFQTNSLQAQKLYQKTREFSALTGKEIVYDLYTGTGTIANFIAPNALKVVGIESVPEAIIDAKVNSEINNIENTSFHSGDMKDIFTSEFIQMHGKPDVIITDPPRAGMHPKVVEQILQIEPDRIIYVSCNPATQARDAALLSEKYFIQKCQPVDMFPHTHHIENILLFHRK